MPLLTTDPLTHLSFAVSENKGIFAVLLGSGLSRTAEIPTGWEITLDLIRRVALAQGVTNQSDWARWYHETTGDEPNYSKLLEELASTPDERRAILHSYIEPTDEDRETKRKIPTAAHHALAEMVRAGYVRVIVTTNFDRLMENALREHGVESTVVASADALTGAEPLTHSACYLVKLHGDYKDARILNTDSELSSYPSGFNGLLDRIFDEHGLVICGWSGEWDHALRAALLRTPNRRYPVYWATRSELASGARELAEHRKARIIPIADADSFFKGLSQRVETLEQSRRQNPLSIELLVNSAKRYLAKPEYRIPLDELLTQETDRSLSLIESNKFTAGGSWNQDEFRMRVRRYESAIEPLSRVAGVLGRWGDDGELPIMLDVIRTLHARATKADGGLTVWLDLRSYPAVLIFTAYGLGLVRTQRWAALHMLLSAPILLPHREPERMADLLFLQAWSGGKQDVWKQIEGLDRHKTPLSDHLLALMSEWGKSFAGLSPDFELMFERFEILGSLVYLESTSETELEQSLASRGGDYSPLSWMPVGRIGWDSGNKTRLLHELRSEKTKAALFEAGFACRSPRFLELFLENLNRVAQRMSW